ALPIPTERRRTRVVVGQNRSWRPIVLPTMAPSVSRRPRIAQGIRSCADGGDEDMASRDVVQPRRVVIDDDNVDVRRLLSDPPAAVLRLGADLYVDKAEGPGRLVEHLRSLVAETPLPPGDTVEERLAAVRAEVDALHETARARRLVASERRRYEHLLLIEARL